MYYNNSLIVSEASFQNNIVCKHDDIIDSITEAQAKDFIEWLLLKYEYHLVFEKYVQAREDICVVMTYKTNNCTSYPNPIIMCDGSDVKYVLWSRYHVDYIYRGILKQLFSGHDIYLYWDLKKPIISKNDSFSTLFVEYDLQNCMRQQV